MEIWYVTEETQFCVMAGSTLIFQSVQTRELGQSLLTRLAVNKTWLFSNLLKYGILFSILFYRLTERQGISSFVSPNKL